MSDLVEAALDPPVDTHYKRGDVWTEDPKVNWIWDGWIAEYFHPPHRNAKGPVSRLSCST